MLIRAGYDIAYACSAPTPLLLMLHIRPERRADLRTPENFRTAPEVPHHTYIDGFGNVCTRLVAPQGEIRFTCDLLIADSGLPDPVPEGARQMPVEELPDDVLVFLLGSRYCETDRLTGLAWSLFGHIAPGWTRVKAIADYAHDRIVFGYPNARADRSAADANYEQVGVCRDYAHLAIALCRCMNIPARYCTGYLGDIGMPFDPSPMDFSAWFDVYLDGQWFTWDARHNRPRIGRILMARGRDATDAAISTAFGKAELRNFTVVSEEVAESGSAD